MEDPKPQGSERPPGGGEQGLPPASDTKAHALPPPRPTPRNENFLESSWRPPPTAPCLTPDSGQPARGAPHRCCKISNLLLGIRNAVEGKMCFQEIRFLARQRDQNKEKGPTEGERMFSKFITHSLFTGRFCKGQRHGWEAGVSGRAPAGKGASPGTQAEGRGRREGPADQGRGRGAVGVPWL